MYTMSIHYKKMKKREQTNLNITLKKNTTDVSASEKKTIQIAVLNFISVVNGLQTGKEIVMNKLDDEAADNLGYKVHLFHEVTDEDKEGFIGQAERQMSLFLKMSEIPYEIETAQ